MENTTLTLEHYESELKNLPQSEFLNNLKVLLSAYDDTGFRDKYTDPVSGEEIQVDRYTMLTPELLTNIEYCIRDVVKNDIPGDFIECGVWKGGACIYAKHVLNLLDDDRKVYLADSFQGLPSPNSEKYPQDDGDIHHKYPELGVSVEKVRKNFELFNALDSNVFFIEGFFRDSLPEAKNHIDQISVLRLDADMYEGTIEALENLYDKLSIGGYCIIDDWQGVQGCTKAVEYFREKNEINDIMIPCQVKPSVTGMHPASHFWQKTK